MINLFPSGDTFSIIYDTSHLTQEERDKLITIQSLPDGEGILRQSEDGSFYYEEVNLVFSEFEEEEEEVVPLTMEERILMELQYQTSLLESRGVDS